MTAKHDLLRCWMLLAAASSALGATRYVDVNSASSRPPYTNWTAAAATIQDAVDAAEEGDEILVTNGVYHTGGRVVEPSPVSNRVAVTKAVTVQSVNGAAVTIIRGVQVPGTTNDVDAVRCVYLAAGATLVGFTLTNGATRASGDTAHGEYGPFGGGVLCESESAVVSNCTLAGNSAAWAGGGAFGGTLNNCTLTANSVFAGSGGGASSAILNNCTLTGNSAGYGGGASDCTLLSNCTLAGNSAPSQGGGSFNSSLNNCVITGNSGGGAFMGTLINCTVTGNSGGGVFGQIHEGPSGGIDAAILHNCIVYYNQGFNYSLCLLDYSCTTPLPSGAGDSVGNITNAPLFVNEAGGNLRLQPNSPCINAGNNAYAPPGLDLDGNSRITGGTVDIGAYELQQPTSVISYAWLQHYGLQTDGTADFADPDHDGMNNWQEWRCGTSPTDPLSTLRLLQPAVTSTDVTVRWQSIAGVNYVLERSTNLSALPWAFSVVATNLPGRPGTTTYIDRSALGGGPFFYRVEVGNPESH
jgi:hypothetical protein